MIRPSRAIDSLAPLLAMTIDHRRLLGFALALALCQTASALAIPWLAGRLATHFSASTGGPDGMSLVPLLAVLALVGFHALTSFGSGSAIARSESSMATELRHRLYARYQSLPLARLRRHPMGAALEVLVADVESAATFASRTPVAVPPAIFAVCGSLIALATLDPWLPLWFAGTLVPLWWTTRRLSRPITHLSERLAIAHGRLLDVLQENLSNAATIKAHVQERRELRRESRFDRAVQWRRDAQMRQHLLVSPATHFAGAIACAGLVAIAASVPGRFHLSPGELVAALLYGLVFMRSFGGAAEIRVQVQQARAAARRLSAIESEPVEEVETDASSSLMLRGDVELRGVHFSHAGAGPTLRGLDLRIRPGELVALVGPNGAGKTTLAELLLRFHRAGRGEVRIDGRNVDSIPRDALRRQVVLAAQETQLFGRSVRDNIAFGCPRATDEEIREAAERSGAAAFIQELPNGYSTRIENAGRRLSGGQRQRIALARALLCQPRVLILDEATSMFDAEGEIEFLRRNREWLRGRTTLLITHRPESLALADRIVTLRDGRVALTAPQRVARDSRESQPRTPGTGF